MAGKTPRQLQYAELLRDPRWKAKREEVFARWGRQCSVCGAFGPDTEMHVHHKVYRGNAKPWEYCVQTELTPICIWCHFRHHDEENMPAERRQRLEMIRQVLLRPDAH